MKLLQEVMDIEERMNEISRQRMAIIKEQIKIIKARANLRKGILMDDKEDEESNRVYETARLYAESEENRRALVSKDKE